MIANEGNRLAPLLRPLSRMARRDIGRGQAHWRIALLGMALLIPLQAIWTGCASFGGDDESVSARVPAPPPAPQFVEQPSDADTDQIAIQPQHVAGSTIEDCLLPPENAWVKLARMRGIDWPMVANWGVCHRYEPQKGLVSYYHEPQSLASGGRFNPDGLTAAHKSLPFGTIVRCRRTDSKESVVVIVNDRGPYVDGRIIDLSERAARSIHLINDGVVRCELEVLAYPMIDTMGPDGNG